jgi:hypothetical protein
MNESSCLTIFQLEILQRLDNKDSEFLTLLLGLA